MLQSHLPVILPRNVSFNVEEGIGGSSPCPPSFLGAWVPACPSQGQTSAWALPSSLSFWDLRARCCCPALYFHTIISLESAQSLRAGLSPKSRHRPAQGRADVPISGSRGQPGVTRTQSKGSAQKVLSERDQVKKKAQNHKNNLLFPVVKSFFFVFYFHVKANLIYLAERG